VGQRRNEIQVTIPWLRQRARGGGGDGGGGGEERRNARVRRGRADEMCGDKTPALGGPTA
jgi:hypothetical protein